MTVFIYPEAVWYGRVKLQDMDEIIQSHIVGGAHADEGALGVAEDQDPRDSTG